MTDHEIRQFYSDIPDFRTYVDKCREADGRSVDEELKLMIVQKVAENYKECMGIK